MTMRIPVISKYRFNQVLFFINCFVVAAVFYYLLTRSIGFTEGVTFFILIGFCQHYFLNIVHLSSHFLLSKDRKWNAFFGNMASIIGGVTFADFRTTHHLHHRHVSDEQKDPDHWITTSGNVFTIPFKIFYHDYYFWSKGLWKRGNWRGYVIDRSVQIGFIFAFYFTGHINVWQNFWLLPLLVVGFSNGLFLFYFPHYTAKFERKWRNNTRFIHQKLTLLAIDISRIFHEKHHDRIAENQNYFPVFTYLLSRFQGVWTSLSSAPLSKYTDIEAKA
jgi:fatty acid desaturase